MIDLGSDITQEKVKELKRMIDLQLRSKDVYGQIRSVLSDFLNQNQDIIDVNSEESVLQSMRERGILEQVINTLNGQGNRASIKDDVASSLLLKNNKQLLKNKRLLHLKILGGKAFLEFPDEQDAPVNEKLFVSVHFDNQRFRSTPVTCCNNPAFDEDFIVELAIEQSNDLQFDETVSMLQLSFPLHIIVVRIDDEGRYHFVGGHMVEWRKVLKRGVIMMSVELGGGAGYDMKVPKGILDIRLEIIPRPTVNIPENEITSQVNIEKTRETQADREFYLYSKQWYEEYQQIRESHKNRLVKLYAEAENGITKPVIAFVTPMRAERLIDSPSHAARFVSCISYEPNNPVLSGSPTKEIWWTMHSFLSKLGGGMENHSLLLCSLFLGFKLDAYVCVGTDNKGAKVWVMTRASDGKVTFWDSVTGMKSAQLSENHQLRTIGCVFNHESFYANIQKSGGISDCNFDLENEMMWKSMSKMKLSLVKKFPKVPLCPPTGNTFHIEEQTEMELRKLIDSNRKDLGLSTYWDHEMGYILTPALQSYELSSVSNIASNSIMTEFQECVKHCVPDGHTFKGFPIQLNYTSPKRIITACLRHKSFKDIIECVGDQIRFGVRVKIYSYPESVYVVWVIVACMGILSIDK